MKILVERNIESKCTKILLKAIHKGNQEKKIDVTQLKKTLHRAHLSQDMVLEGNGFVSKNSPVLVGSLSVQQKRREFAGTLCLLNPSNAQLNPIRHLLASLGARHLVHVSRVRVKQTKRLCNYAYMRRNYYKYYVCSPTRYTTFVMVEYLLAICLTARHVSDVHVHPQEHL